MKKSKLIVGTLLAVDLLLVSSTAMTVAWYFRGVSGLVDNIEVSLMTDKILKISLTGEPDSFKDELDYSELQHVEYFSPVSSVYSSSWIEKRKQEPEFNASYHQKTKAGGGFYSQAFYLYSGDDAYATLDADRCTFTPNEEKNAKAYESVKELFPSLSKEEIIANLNNVTKSLRVSILVPDEENYAYTIFDPYKEGDTYLGGILDTDSNGYFDFDNAGGEKAETLYGDVSNIENAIYDGPFENDIITTKQKTCFEANRKAGVKLFNKEASINNGLVIAKEEAAGPNELDAKMRIPVYENGITKIVLSIYLEGWDVDNTNLVRYASFNMDLRFKILGRGGI